MRTGYLILAVILLAVAAVLIVQPSAQAPLTVDGKLSLDTVHLACTPAEQRTGLSRFDTLPDQEGMLFVFNKERTVSFWMKDMDFSIDIVWINADHQVTKVEHAVPLCGTNCSFAGTGKYVLELPAGTAATHNVETGDRVTIRDTC